MKTEGWTYGDLMGELWARGIDIDEVTLDEACLQHPTPTKAARYIERGEYERKEARDD